MIYLDLFLTFLSIGAFTFGGGYAMLPLIQDAVLEHEWLSEEAIVNFIAVSESTPGPFAINIATYVGMETGGFFGAVCATMGIVVPSFVVILIVAKIYKKFQESKLVKGCMSGLRPAVIGLIAGAVITIGQAVFLPQGFNFASFDVYSFIVSLVIFILGIFLIFKKKIHPILFIILAAGLGIAAGYIGKLL